MCAHLPGFPAIHTREESLPSQQAALISARVCFVKEGNLPRENGTSVSSQSHGNQILLRPNQKSLSYRVLESDRKRFSCFIRTSSHKSKTPRFGKWKFCVSNSIKPFRVRLSESSTTEPSSHREDHLSGKICQELHPSSSTQAWASYVWEALICPG